MEAEKLIHRYIERFTNLRIRDNREFFNVAPQIALDIFRDIASTLDDAEITLYKDNIVVDTMEVHKLKNGVSTGYNDKNEIDLDIRVPKDCRTVRVDPAFAPCIVTILDATWNGKPVREGARGSLHPRVLR